MSDELKRIILVVGGFFLGILYVYSPYLIELINDCSLVSAYATCQGSYLGIYTPLYISYWIPFATLLFPLFGLGLGVFISKNYIKSEPKGLSEKELSVVCISMLLLLTFLTGFY